MEQQEDKPKFRQREKRPAVKRLLEEGVLPRARIREQVGCTQWLIDDVARQLAGVPDSSVIVEDQALNLLYQDCEYVSRQWLVINLGLCASAISRNLKKRKVPFITRRRKKYRVPARFFLLSKVWEVLPEWKKQFEKNRQRHDGRIIDERHQFGDISDGQYAVLCGLIEWWIEQQYWPSADDLLTVPAVAKHYQNADQVCHHLRELQRRNYLTRQGPPVSRGERQFNRRFIIHRAPRRLTGRLVYCSGCKKAFRVLWPFYVPK